MDFQSWSVASRTRVEDRISEFLAKRAPLVKNRGDAVLAQAMGYGVLGGGKRIRALLAIAGGKATQAKPEDCEMVGAAIECIHAFSLVHDDMPCMDDDDLRRGQPTVHVKFGEPQALLVGDALQTMGFEMLSSLELPAEKIVDLVRRLAIATGLQGMAGGQAVDIAAVGSAMAQNELEAMHALKTGALIQASVEMGAVCGEPSAADMAALGQYAAAVGLAFQVADDVLDVTADAKTLGKTPGKDAASNKPNFVALLGLEGARGYARDLHGKAVGALEPLGDRADLLRQLAQSLVQRTH